MNKYPLERLTVSLLRLVYGKGQDSVELAHVFDIDTALTSGEQSMEIILPYGPPVFFGRLFSLKWRWKPH